MIYSKPVNRTEGFILSLLCVAFFSISCTGAPEKQINSELLRSYSLIDSAKTESSRLFIYSDPEKGSRIELEIIEGISATDAQDIIQQEQTGIKLIYSDTLSPYPGELSYRISAPDSIKPVFKKSPVGEFTYEYALLYSNSRFSYGLSSMADAQYRFLSGWLINENAGVLNKIRIFVPLDEEPGIEETIFFSFKCAE
jgi:hypothetical protein